ERNFYDTEGRLLQTATWDETGKLAKMYTVENSRASGEAATHSEETRADGHQDIREVTERTDAKTRITRQTSSLNGQVENDWTIERNPDGEALRDTMVYANGSPNPRDKTADGWTIEDRYDPTAKTHFYLKWKTKDGLITDSIQESESQYL